MIKIITDKAQVNNYLLTKNKADNQATLKKQQAHHDRRKVELEMAMDPEEQEFRIKDSQLAQAIGAELVTHYPGHGWQVESDIRNGVAKIFNCHMSGVHGYLLHLKTLGIGAQFQTDIMRLGGTLLESFGLNRGKAIDNQIMDIQRDHAGQVKADY